MPEFREKTDVCIIGAGHAGCEAALACARLGLQTVIFTVNIESIAMGILSERLMRLAEIWEKILIRLFCSLKCLISQKVLLFILCGVRRIRRSTAGL